MRRIKLCTDRTTAPTVGRIYESKVLFCFRKYACDCHLRSFLSQVSTSKLAITVLVYFFSMADPISIAASVVTLAQLCRGLIAFFRDTAGPAGRVLRDDIKELQNQLTELGIQYDEATRSGIPIAPRISKRVHNIQAQCMAELDTLRRTLEPIRFTIPEVITWLNRPDAINLRYRINKYQQSLHYYFTLINA